MIFGSIYNNNSHPVTTYNNHIDPLCAIRAYQQDQTSLCRDTCDIEFGGIDTSVTPTTICTNHMARHTMENELLQILVLTRRPRWVS